MIKVKGFYDGQVIQLLEPVTIEPNTTVDLVIQESDSDYQEKVRHLHQGMLEARIITHVPSENPDRSPVERVSVTGKPVSQTVIDERR